MKRDLPFQIGSFLLILLSAGCEVSDDSVGGGWVGSADTLPSGQIIVRNTGAGVWEGSMTLQERFRLGTLDEDGPELFGQIADLELGPQGEVYVLEGQALEIRVFEEDGTFRHSFGREGEGPGELKNPAGFALDSHGTLWLLNWGNGRYSGFDPVIGTVSREARRLVSFAMFPWPGAFEEGTHLLDVGLSFDGEPSILRLDTAFVPHDTLPLPEPNPADRISFHRGSVMIAAMPEPFAPQPAWAPRPSGGVVFGESSEYRLHRVGFDRDTSMTIEMERERVRTTEAERDSALAQFDEISQGLVGATPDRRPKAFSTKPAHGQLFVDDQDRTWVWIPAAEGATPSWDVFGSDGRFLGQVDVPVSSGFVSVVVRGNRMALATQVDGYPMVIVYDLVQEVS